MYCSLILLALLIFSTHYFFILLDNVAILNLFSYFYLLYAIPFFIISILNNLFLCSLKSFSLISNKLFWDAYRFLRISYLKFIISVCRLRELLRDIKPYELIKIYYKLGLIFSLAGDYGELSSEGACFSCEGLGVVA